MTTTASDSTFGRFVIDWQVDDGKFVARFTAYRIINVDGGPQIFRMETGAFTEDRQEAEPYLTGFVKWDGCMEVTDGMHWCDREHMEEDFALLRHLREAAFGLMGRADDGDLP